MIDPHPIHMHLTKFQVISRRKFNSKKYRQDFLDLNGPMPYKINVRKFPNISNYI
jgi:FtsP/CotA-like multicopper oxidase with cupredoxin domain